MLSRRAINQSRAAEEDELDRRIEQIIDTRLERRLDMIVDRLAKRMEALREAQQEVDPGRRRVPNPTADFEDVEYDSYSEGDANIFAEDDPSDDTFFLAGGNEEFEFDKEEETKRQEDTVLPNDGEFVANSFDNGSNWDFHQYDDVDIGDRDTSFVDPIVPRHIEENEKLGFRQPESDEDDDFDEADSGETGAEFCQVGSSTCSVPFELYDLPNLEDVLSVNVWSECLTEEERLSLAKILPNMDQETYMRTMMELFKGCNFNFGSPLKKLFDMLNGGLCSPRVAFYREGRNSFDKREHYHFLKMHQNGGYNIEEKLRVLNIVKNQKSLMCKKETLWDY
ncbi:hypothetical protein CRG98_010884 [Punica granatum]|uniref:DEUBAD domain-containing protein n=1 Tax=Punica granatum TaxID=22663 RepID=A0A2I0KJX8_PUNGR|nr:hypothetical protein CRG98_010884 [Punica granatum]